MKLAVVGLGKLGLPTAACFAQAGIDVIGTDCNEAHVQALQEGRCPIEEPGLPELLRDPVVQQHLTFEPSVEAAARLAPLILLIVPTPSGEDNRFVNDYLLEAFKPVAAGLIFQHQAGAFPVVDVVSTVMPEAGRKVLIPRLEELTGLRCGAGFGYVYNPEFIALGTVIRNFRAPDMVLIGESDHEAGSLVEDAYRTLFKAHAVHGALFKVQDGDLFGGGPSMRHVTWGHICRMSVIEAELAKLAVNCYLSTKIAYANLIGLLVGQYKGADVDVVLDAVGKDSRVGRKFLQAGMGFSGPCLPRDVRALRSICNPYLNPTAIPLTYRAYVDEAPYPQEVINALSVRSTVTLINGLAPPGPIAVLGVTYKPGSHVLDDSQSIQIMIELAEYGRKIVWYDPYAKADQVEAALGNTSKLARRASSVSEAISGACGLAVLTRDPAFMDMDWATVEQMLAEKAVFVDPWRLAKGHRNGFKRIAYKPFGIGK